MGKGSKARPLSVDGQEFADNWDKIFNKEPDGQKPIDDGNDPVIEDPDFDELLKRNPETGMLEVELDDLIDYVTPEIFGTNFDLAGDFMKAFGQEVLSIPKLPEPDLAKLRLELIREEVEELNVGIEGMDIVEIADALTDILYVVYGAGHAFGINLDDCFKEVHDSNMSKLGADGKPIYREDGKVMKGPNYRPPSLARFCQ